MNHTGRHAKETDPFESAVMNLMVIIERNETHLQRDHIERKNVQDKLDSVAEEMYSSFAIYKKAKDALDMSKVTAETTSSSDMYFGEMPASARAARDNRMEVRTGGCQRHHRRKASTILLLIAVLILQIYTAWQIKIGMLELVLICLKYAGVLFLTIRLFHWIISGEMRDYLNQNGE